VRIGKELSRACLMLKPQEHGLEAKAPVSHEFNPPGRQAVWNPKIQMSRVSAQTADRQISYRFQYPLARRTAVRIPSRVYYQSAVVHFKSPPAP